MQTCGAQQTKIDTMYLEGSIPGGQVKDLITKFFYKDNFLCFHILLNVESGENVFFQEFMDYSEYKKTFNELQQARNSNDYIDIPKSNLKNTSATMKVA